MKEIDKLFEKHTLTVVLMEIFKRKDWQEICLACSNAATFQRSFADDAGENKLAKRWHQRAQLFHDAYEIKL